jgi:hypothetical protein
VIFLPYLVAALVLWLVWIFAAFAAALRPGWRYDRPIFLPFTLAGVALGLAIAYVSLPSVGPTIQKQSLLLLPVARAPVWAVLSCWGGLFVAVLFARKTWPHQGITVAAQYFSAGVIAAIPMLAPMLLGWSDEILASAGIRVIFIP